MADLEVSAIVRLSEGEERFLDDLGEVEELASAVKDVVHEHCDPQNSEPCGLEIVFDAKEGFIVDAEYRVECSRRDSCADPICIARGGMEIVSRLHQAYTEATAVVRKRS